ncbi:MAG: 4-alpha-glucanotransferase [Gammaproteobacteria bacterium]
MSDAKSNNCLGGRRAGVMLHITSLPGLGINGDMGEESRHFVDFLVDSGFSYWQTLPAGPTRSDNSPYSTSSIHAGNPLLIDLNYLVQRYWLDASFLNKGVLTEKKRLQSLRMAWNVYTKLAGEHERAHMAEFTREQGYWLDDYALFRAIRKDQDCRAWWEWPAPLRDREPEAIAKVRARLAREIEYIGFEQFVFFQQWHEMKNYANRRGVKLFGDMPIFVAHDSAEVWVNRQYFLLDQNGAPKVVAGVPPDYFSDTGQRWGNPLYDWDRLQEDGFTFWIQRMKTQLAMFDLVRIDHFRGFESCWEIPAEDETAIYGRWVSTPGQELFECLHKEYHSLPLVAEDLGLITPEVEALRDRFGLPGMKVLQFAFSGDHKNPHLPFKYPTNSVVYAGTHDNNTTIGWYESLDQDTRRYVDEFLGDSRLDMPWPMLWKVLSSPSDLAILQMQDLLELDGNHRMNTPGTTEGNWLWRFKWDQVDPGLAAKLRHRIAMYGRLAYDQ